MTFLQARTPGNPAIQLGQIHFVRHAIKLLRLLEPVERSGTTVSGPSFALVSIHIFIKGSRLYKKLNSSLGDTSVGPAQGRQGLRHGSHKIRVT